MAELEGPACSDWARRQHLDPVGTAGSFRGYLLVEHPLPWPSDISELPQVAALARLAAEAGLRAQAIFPTLSPGGADDDHRHLICYRGSEPGWAAPLVRSELRVRPEELTDAAAALVGGPAPLVTVPPAHEAAAGLVDVLICTHGRRDACCGAHGTELFASLVADVAARATAAAGAGAQGHGQALRVWRTSHTGGHRFAPTALVLPSATLWAWADVALLRSAAAMTGPVDDLFARYRGCAVLGSPRQQALERAVWREVGWDLLQGRRRVSDQGDELVRLEAQEHGEWEAIVRPGRRVLQPECHGPLGQASKYGVEWVVEGLRQVVSAPA
jgi:hypothetical protein